MAMALKGEVSGAWTARQQIVTGALWLWSLRYHIFYAWDGWRSGLTIEDWRYEDMRVTSNLAYPVLSLLGMHIVPTVLVFAAFVPAGQLMLLPEGGQTDLGLGDALSAIIAIVAVFVQWISDEQLRKFRTSPAYSNGGCMVGGLWAWSRHPNYFGEALFWLFPLPCAWQAGILSAWNAIGGVIMVGFFCFRCDTSLLATVFHKYHLIFTAAAHLWTNDRFQSGLATLQL